jgi:hypothetical protein
LSVEWVLQLCLFSVLHWVLVGILLQDLSRRDKVLGGRKWPWALSLIFLIFIGSLLYLVCHPRIFINEDNQD